MDAERFKKMISDRAYPANYLMGIVEKHTMGFDILYESITCVRFDFAYRLLSVHPGMGNNEEYYFNQVVRAIELDNIDTCDAWKIVRFFQKDQQQNVLDLMIKYIGNSGLNMQNRIEALIRGLELIVDPKNHEENMEEKISIIFHIIFIRQEKYLNMSTFFDIFSTQIENQIAKGLYPHKLKGGIAEVSSLKSIEDLSHYYIHKSVEEQKIYTSEFQLSTLVKILRKNTIPYGKAEKLENDFPVLFELVSRKEETLSAADFEILLKGFDKQYLSETVWVNKGYSDHFFTLLECAAEYGKVNYIQTIINMSNRNLVHDAHAVEAAIKSKNYACVLEMVKNDIKVGERYWKNIYNDFITNSKAYELLKEILTNIMKISVERDTFNCSDKNYESKTMCLINAISQDSVLKDYPHKAFELLKLLIPILPYRTVASKSTNTHSYSIHKEIFISSIKKLLEKGVPLNRIWTNFSGSFSIDGEIEKNQLSHIFTSCIREHAFFHQIIGNFALLQESLNYVCAEDMMDIMTNSGNFESLNEAMANDTIDIKGVLAFVRIVNFVKKVKPSNENFFEAWSNSENFKLKYIPISAWSEIYKIEPQAAEKLLSQYKLSFRVIVSLLMQGCFSELLQLINMEISSARDYYFSPNKINTPKCSNSIPCIPKQYLPSLSYLFSSENLFSNKQGF